MLRATVTLRFEDDDAIERTIEAETLVTRARPARISGPAEGWHPASHAEVEIVSIALLYRDGIGIERNLDLAEASRLMGLDSAILDAQIEETALDQVGTEAEARADAAYDAWKERRL